MDGLQVAGGILQGVMGDRSGGAHMVPLKERVTDCTSLNGLSVITIDA